jgi:hypothetical protein
MNPTLIQLQNFVLQNDTELDTAIIQTYLNDSKSSWSKGK